MAKGLPKVPPVLAEPETISAPELMPKISLVNHEAMEISETTPLTQKDTLTY